MIDIKDLKLRAEQGDANAQFELGVMYAEGNSVSRDYVETEHWFRKAADQGDADAQFNLGMMYRGRVVDLEDDGHDEQAAHWWLKAAEQNHAEAQDNLGSICEEEGDYITAHKWYSVAAAQGNEHRMEYLDLLEESMSLDEIAEAKRQTDQWLRAHGNASEQ